jgi:hypothetical protein
MLELVHADCEQLQGSVQATAELADHISGKVRRLDTVQTRVSAVLNKVGLILDRTACINGVQAAMEAEVGLQKHWTWQPLGIADTWPAHYKGLSIAGHDRPTSSTATDTSCQCPVHSN